MSETDPATKWKYHNVFLRTTSELTKAGQLYLQAGFKKTEVKSHIIWGKFITEERYDLQLNLI